MHLLIAYFLSKIPAKYYENPTMLSRVIVKNIVDAFWDTVYNKSTHVTVYRLLLNIIET